MPAKTTKAKPKRKTAVKAKPKAKTVSKKTPANKSISARLDELEAQVALLESHDITRRAESAYKKASETVKDNYASNPTTAIAIALAVIFFILLLIS